MNTAQLKTKEFGKDYYEEHKSAGLDYLGHGYWQESYGRMVSNALLQESETEPKLLDFGCACGSILKGFAKMGIYKEIRGVDVNPHMIDIGRRRFNFSCDELICYDGKHLPFPDNHFSAIHTAQVLEHIDECFTDPIFAEVTRVLKNDGRIFMALDAVRFGETKDMYMGDPTHVNLQPSDYWSEKITKHGLIVDMESYDRYARSECGPTEGIVESFFQTYRWSVWICKKLRVSDDV